jgi:DNA-binding response OmpR family regulator
MARLLLVEDYDEVRRALAAVLSAEGYSVTTASAHGDAPEHLASAAFDLVIADVALPGGRGTDICHRARSRGIKCLLITGYPHVAQALLLKGVDFLQKPFRRTELLQAVRARLKATLQ